MTRICVTGGRDYTDRKKVYATLDSIPDISLVIHGGATGADQLASDWAKSRGHMEEVYGVTKDEWARIGPSAGPIRNGRMLREGRPNLLVAFPGGRGTADCTKQAKGLKIKVVVVE